jgi:hypothetical protein
MAWPYRRYSNRGGPTTLNYQRSTPTPADPAEMARIDAVMNNPAFSSLPTNKQEFIKSIKGQAGSKGLSAAQLNYLASIEKSLAPVDNSWFNATDSEMVRKREFAKNYFGATGYYSTIVAKMTADPAFVPDKAHWDKMWANKFINARYKRFIDGHTLNVGDIAIGKYSYGGPHNGIIQGVTYNYFDGRWQYTFLSFDGRTMTFKDSEIKPAEKPARKARSKKV